MGNFRMRTMPAPIKKRAEEKGICSGKQNNMAGMDYGGQPAQRKYPVSER